MGELQDFDQALARSSKSDGDAWADDGVVLVGQMATKLSDDDLSGCAQLWPARPMLWQKHCAEVLDQARHAEAIELLADMVDKASPEVALAALESLSTVDPTLFSLPQNARILRATRYRAGAADRAAAPAAAGEVPGEVEGLGARGVSSGGLLVCQHLHGHARGHLSPALPDGSSSAAARHAPRTRGAADAARRRRPPARRGRTRTPRPGPKQGRK